MILPTVGSVNASCIYSGTLHHRRVDLGREFNHPLSLFYIDLQELPTLLGGRLIAPGFGALRWRRGDYHGPESRPLQEAVRDTVQAQTGTRPGGPIRMLSALRTFGHCFNPVSFYYCFAPDAKTVEAVLAEVTNTPWGERHAYVVSGESGTFQKAMHVSPFMEMDYDYRCEVPAPGQQLRVAIENRRGDLRTFEASLTMSRSELNERSVNTFLRRYPLASLRVLALIYGHAIALKLSGARHYPHPERKKS